MEENVNLRDSSEKFVMSWRGVHYDISLGTKGDVENRKTILDKVSGYAISGEVMAIMGPSGSGKTSLLNFLNNRIGFPAGSKYESEIFINSESMTPNMIAKYSSYVMQDDLLFDILTPEETLLFVAKLKKKQTKEQYQNQVDVLLEELKLTKCKNTIIGNATRKGISGGERKRVSIGIEIISNPSILFLDEPTSGLDSQTSLIVIDFMKELAMSKNIIIIFTIHQPSSNIFFKFDRLMILNKGMEVYFGQTANVSEYFNIMLNKPLSTKANPADSFMHLIETQNAILEGKVEDVEIENEIPFTTVYKQELNKIIMEEIETNLKKPKYALKKKNLQTAGFLTEFNLLSYRAVLNLIRNPLTLRVRLIMVLVFSFIACSIFYNMGNDPIGLYNKAGFFFFFTVNNYMTIVFSAVLAFPQERGVFLREHSGKLYGVLPYYLSKNIIETPIGLFITFVYGIIVYYICGLRTPVVNYFTFQCIFVVLAFLAQSVGLCFGAAFSNLNTAMIITQFSVLPAFLFSGFLINQANMPAWLAWLRFFSPFRYSIEASLRNEFDDNPLVPAAMSPVTALNLDIGMWNCVVIMIAWGVGLRTLGYFFLKKIVTKVG